jgi:hypothetical protein
MILMESWVPMTNGLSTGLADSPARILVRRLGILSVAMAAGLAVVPTYVAAEPATQSGAKVLYLAQAASQTEQPASEEVPATPVQPAGEEAAAGEQATPESPATDSPAKADNGEPALIERSEAAEAAEVPAAEEPAAKPAEAPAAGEPAAEAAEMPAAPEPAAGEPAVEPATQTVSEPQPLEGLPGYPPILRKDAEMPEPVRKTWAALRDAARRGDIEALGPLIEAQPSPPTFAFDEIDQPILYLKSLSGDPEGREILAILLEVLESGFVLADPDTPEAMYLWPYFSRYPLEELTPEQMVEMFTLLTAGDYQDMLSYGAYIFFRVGISPDGTWHFFVAGD